MCLVHSAALVAEYLAMLESLPYLPAGAAALEKVFAQRHCYNSRSQLMLHIF